MGGLLATLVQDSATLIAGGARANLNNLWTSKVLPFCREAINERYPFEKGSRRDTTPLDFARLFGPGGLLDAFFSEHLSQIADTSRRTWRWAGGGIGIPDAVLVQFQRAATIREAFFTGGGKIPAVSFELTPTRMDAGASQLILDIGGQILDYRHGPLKPQALQWPSPEGLGRARLVLHRRGRQRVQLSPKRVPGPGSGCWTAPGCRPPAKRSCSGCASPSAGLSADFDLRAASVRNPFQLDELRGFRCPERL